MGGGGGVDEAAPGGASVFGGAAIFGEDREE